MSDIHNNLALTEEESTDSRESAVSAESEDSAVEPNTIYVDDRQGDLPRPDHEPSIGVALSTSDEIDGKTVHVYVGNEWADTHQSAEELVSELVDEVATKSLRSSTPGFGIADVNAPAEVDPEETVTIEVALNNTGVNDHAGTVELMGDGEPIDSAEPTVTSGETEWFDLEWTAPSAVGSYSLTVETAADTEPVVIDVGELAPEFSVDDFSVRSDNPVEGQPVVFEQTVHNSGTNATADVELHVLGSDMGVVDTQSVVIDGDSTESVTLEWETDVGDSNAVAGDDDDSAAVLEDVLYQIRVSHASTRHDTVSDRFYLNEHVESLLVAEPTVSPTNPTLDKTLTVKTILENTGTVSRTTDVTLSVDDSEVATEQNVEITPDEPTTVTHAWTPDDDGQQTLTVSASGYHSSTTVEVFDGPASFETSNISISPDPVEPNEPITVSVDVENTGGKSGSRTIELKRSGEVYDEKPDLSLDPQQSTSLSLTGTAPDTTGTKWFYINTQDKLQQATVDVRQTLHFEVTNIRVTPSEVRQGDIVAVDAEIKNTADVEATPTVELRASGNPTDLVEPTIRGRATTEVTLRWNSANYNGPVELTVSANGVHESTTVEIKEPLEPAAFGITSFSAPNEITRGETATITSTIENTGELEGTPTVELSVDDTQVDSTDPSIDGGETTAVSFSWDSSDYDESVELTVSADDSSESTTVDIEALRDSAAFRVADISAPSAVEQGETVAIDTAIENIGDIEETATVELDVDGTHVESIEPSIGGGETTEVSLSWDSSDYDGKTTLSVSADDTSESTTVDIEAPPEPAAFKLTRLSAPTEITRGETVAIETTIQNVGEAEGTPSVELAVDGTRVDSAEPSIDGSETTELSLGWDSVDYKESAELTVSVDDTTKSTTVDIEEPRDPAAYEITRLKTPMEVTSGENISIETKIENVGEAEGTPPVTLFVDGNRIGSSKPSISGGDTETVSFNWDSSGYSGMVAMTVSAGKSSKSTSLNIEAPPEPVAFELTDLNTPPAVEVGETVAVDAAVTNVGDVGGTPTVTLVVDGDQVDSAEPTVDATDTAEVSLSWDSSGYTGPVELTVSADETSESVTVDVEELGDPAAFELTNLDAPAEVEPGESVSVDATLHNTGDVEGTPIVELVVDGTQVDTAEPTIDGSETAAVSFSWDSSGYHGTAALTVSADKSSESTTVDVQEPHDPAAFELTSLDAPTEVTEGDSVAVNASVTNTGDVEGTPTVELAVNGTQVDTAEPTIDGSETTAVSFSWDSSGYNGAAALTVSVDKSSESTAVDVEALPEPAAFELTSLDAPTEVTEGDSVAVNASVTNTGDVEGTPTVELVVDGTQVDTAEPTIDGTETTAVSFSWDSSGYTGAAALTVSADDTSESTTVDVEAPPEPAAFELTDLSVPTGDEQANTSGLSIATSSGGRLTAPTEVTQGDLVTINAVVKNTGEVEGTPEVKLSVDGTQVDSVEPPIGGGQIKEVRFSWECSEYDGETDLTVSVDGSNKSTLLDIEETVDPAAFELTSLDVPAEITKGDTVDIDAAVTNVGDVEATPTITLDVNGDRVDSTETPIDGAQTAAVSFSWDSSGHSGPVELTVSVDDSSESATVDVHEPFDPAAIELTDLTIPAEVEVGETVVVDTTVTNSSDVGGTPTIALVVDDTQIDSTELPIDGAETREISFSWDSSNYGGPVDVTVSADDSSESATVDVQEPIKLSGFELIDLSAPEWVTQGETVTIDATVKNFGDFGGTPTVTLAVDGTQVDSTEPTIDGAETREISFEWGSSHHSGPVELTVSADDSTDSTTVDVEEPLALAAFNLVSLSAPPEVTQGEPVVVDTEIENTGDVEGTPTVVLVVNGETIDSTEPLVDGGTTTEVSFSWESTEYSGSVDVAVSVDGTTDSTTVDVEPSLDPAAFELTDLSTPTEVEAGETVFVGAEVTNTGEVGAAPTITLVVDGDQVGSSQPTVGGGETEAVSFSWDSTKYSGPVEQTVSVDDSSESTTVEVEASLDPAAFEVTDLSVPAEVEVGETVTVHAAVSNTGDIEGTPTVTLGVDDSQTDAMELPIDGAETRQISFSWDSSNYGGPVDVTVSADDSSESATVDVQEPIKLSGFELIDLSAPEWVTQGETVTIDATVKNFGDFGGTPTVTLAVDGTQVDSTEPTIDGAETREISFEWGSSHHSGPVELTVSVDDSSDSTVVDVEEPLEVGVFEISSLNAPTEVTQGEAVAVDAAITNTGDTESRPSVVLSADGNQVDSTEPTIGGGETKEVRFDWDSSDQLWSVELTVSVNGATESTTVDVEEQLKSPTFEIQNVTAPPSDPETGESVTVSSNIQNSGGVSGTQEITLQHDGRPVDSAGEVTIEAWETEYVELTWEGTDTTGSETLTVVTDDDSQSTTVDVGVVEAPEFSLGSRVKTTTLATEGDTVSFDQTITNTGSTGTAVVEMIIETAGNAEHVADVKTVELEKGGRTSVTLEWESEIGDGRPAVDDPKKDEYEDPVYRISVYDEQREESALHDSEEDSLILRRASTDE